MSEDRRQLLRLTGILTCISCAIAISWADIPLVVVLPFLVTGLVLLAVSW